MEILTADKNYEMFIEAHESELVERTISFYELFVVLKFLDVITPQEFDLVKVLTTEDEQIRHFYRLLSKKGTGKIKLTLKALCKTSNVQVLQLLETSNSENAINSTRNSDGTTSAWTNPKLLRTQMDRRFHKPTLNSGTEKMQTTDCRSYYLRSRPRGYALIVNNEISNEHVDCLDSTYMTQMFHGLGFRSTLTEDLEALELKKTVLSLKKKFQVVEKADCCAVVLLDHNSGGICDGDGNIKMADGEKVNLIHDLILQFSEANCPELNGKPKLFFIQGCQRNYKYFKNEENVELLSQCMKDTFIVFFTAPENEVPQLKCKGTNLIYHLTKVLMASSPPTEFLSVMNMVSANMKKCQKHKSSENEQLYYQNLQCHPLWFNA